MHAVIGLCRFWSCYWMAQDCCRERFDKPKVPAVLLLMMLLLVCSVDGALLLKLDDERMRKGLGILPLGHREALLKWINVSDLCDMCAAACCACCAVPADVAHAGMCAWLTAANVAVWVHLQLCVLGQQLPRNVEDARP